MDENITVSGTAFLINSEGFILTNEHVVGSRKEMLISLKGDEYAAKVVAVDQVNDLAVLKTNLKDKIFLKFSSKDVEREDDVSALGFGFGKTFSSDVKATRGIVSALSGVANNYSHFQTDAAIQVGNSGGPVINNNTNVVGVAVAKLNTEAAYKQSGTIAENVNFAIKISTIKQFLDSNKISYEMEDGSPIDSKLRNQLIDESVLYIFSTIEENEHQDGIKNAIRSPVAGWIEIKPEFNGPFNNVENKIHKIKDIRTITGLGLKEAKDFVESGRTLSEFMSITDIINEIFPLGKTFRRVYFNGNKFPLHIVADDGGSHEVLVPQESQHYKIQKILIDGNQRVEKNQPLIILQPSSAPTSSPQPLWSENQNSQNSKKSKEKENGWGTFYGFLVVLGFLWLVIYLAS